MEESLLKGFVGTESFGVFCESGKEKMQNLQGIDHETTIRKQSEVDVPRFWGRQNKWDTGLTDLDMDRNSSVRNLQGIRPKKETWMGTRTGTLVK